MALLNRQSLIDRVYTLFPTIMKADPSAPLETKTSIFQGPIFHLHDYGRKGTEGIVPCFAMAIFSTQHPKAPHRIGRHAPETKRRLRTGKCYTFLGLESKKEGDAAIEGVISWLEKHRRSQNKDIWAIYIRSIQQAEIQKTMRFGPFLGEDKTPYLFEWPFINDFSNEELGWECFLGVVVCNRAAEVYVTCE